MSDTSPLRALAHLGLLTLLKDLYEIVLIPPAVVAELAHSPAGLRSIELDAFPFLQVRSPMDLEHVLRFRKFLDEGESEALALAIEVQADVILMDERAARAEAVRLGLHPLGVLGILARCKKEGRISAVKPLIDSLRAELGFFLSEALAQRILSDVGE